MAKFSVLRRVTPPSLPPQEPFEHLHVIPGLGDRVLHILPGPVDQPLGRNLLHHLGRYPPPDRLLDAADI